MNKYKLTYEDALEICANHNNFNFYRKVYDVSGYRVEVFNYFLCGYNMFANPIPTRPEVNAFDMRGATFVFNEDGTLYKKFLMLPKFFNLNEVESTQYNILKNKKIKNVAVKEDGSLIAFMNLPNGKVFAKTLGGLDNSQVIEAMKMYDNDINFQIVVREIIYANCTPLFEYVSFENKIVLNYDKPQLKCIGLRCNDTHKYLSYSHFDPFFKLYTAIKNIVGVNSIEGKSLDDLIEICKNEINIEGFVVEFEDGQLIKCKTKWYFDVHHLHTEDINREDYVIEQYLKGTLDDILAQFDFAKDSNVYDFVLNIKIAVNRYMEELMIGTRNLYAVYVNDYNSNLKEFLIREHKNPYFNFAKALVQDKNDSTRCMQLIKEYIIKKTFKLQNARQLVEQYGVKKD